MSNISNHPSIPIYSYLGSNHFNCFKTNQRKYYLNFMVGLVATKLRWSSAVPKEKFENLCFIVSDYNNLKIVPEVSIIKRLFVTTTIIFSGGLTTSQFPVFTIYIQKLCLPSPTCRRAWTFESVEGFAMDQYAKKRGRLPSRENCMALCRSEKDFPCR